jgi:hypothetical protein
MSKRTIFAIGLGLPDVEGLECFPIDSDQGLLDADVVVFRPDLYRFRYYSEEYQGKPLLTERMSFLLAEKIAHWRQQLNAAFEAGKTVIVFLPARDEVFRYTGQSISQSGRGITKHVAPVNNYEFLPIRFDELVSGRGEAMKLAPGSEIIASYWDRFSAISFYEVYFAVKSQPLVLTRSGNRTVGALIKGRGNIVCLPSIAWDDTGFTTKDGERWTRAAEKFAFSLRDAAFDIDAKSRVDSDETPEPDWAKSDTFRLGVERELEAKILKLGNHIETLIGEREEKRRELKDLASLRALLFEKGRRLESAVRDGLSILGFESTPLKKDDSEFDAVFVSSEGRFLGEVEGKDKNSINIDKFSQLERNIHEDLAREEVAIPAKGVLFGNAQRLLPIGERGEFFTAKVLAAAARTGCALVRTPDLFEVARYVKDSGDEKFAELCRKVIAAAAGEIVVFPAVPVAQKQEITHSD